MIMFNHDMLNFEVEKFDLGAFNPNFGGAPGSMIDPKLGVGLRRADTKEPIAIVSDGYTPVQYLTIVEELEQAIRMAGVDTSDAEFITHVIGKGEQLELTAKFTAHGATVDGNNDWIIPQFKFRTSHNRTWANNGMMGFFRWACYNTLVDGNKLAYVYARHSKKFSVPSFASKIRIASEFISGESLENMKSWYNTSVSRDTVIDLFTKTLAKRLDNVKREEVANKVMLSNLMKTFDEENRHLIGRGNYEKYAQRSEGTLWTAYQAATSWSTHVGSRLKVANANTVVSREDKVRKMLASAAWKELETV